MVFISMGLAYVYERAVGRVIVENSGRTFTLSK